MSVTVSEPITALATDPFTLCDCHHCSHLPESRRLPVAFLDVLDHLDNFQINTAPHPSPRALAAYADLSRRVAAFYEALSERTP